MSTKRRILTGDPSTPEIRVPNTGDETYTAPVTLNDATGDEVAFEVEYVVNKATSGNDTGLLVSMTDTASPGTTLLADFQVDSSSIFSIDINGNVTLSGTVDGVDVASIGSNSHTAVTLSGTGTYLSLSGQDIQVDPITESDISDLGTTVAMVADNLSVFAATTSAQLAGVISDETGSGALVFGTSPTIATPTLTLKQSADPTPTTEGDIQWDTDNDRIVVGTGGNTKVFSSDDVLPSLEPNIQTTDYTVASTDNGKTIIMDSAANTVVSIEDGLDLNFHFSVVQVDTGKVTVSMANTEIINGGANTFVDVSAQWKGLYVAKYSNTEWLAIG